MGEGRGLAKNEFSRNTVADPIRRKGSVMRLLLILATILLPGTVLAGSGSIFDDQDPTQKTPTPAPVSPSPAPDRSSSPSPSPGPTPSPSSTLTPTPSPFPQPAPAPEASPNDAPLDLGARAREAFKKAKQLAAEYLAQATNDVQAQLDSNYQYQASRARADQLSDRLASVRLVGTTEQKLSASAEYTRAAAEVKRMRDEAYSGSPAYLEAKTMDAAFNPPIPAATPVAATATATDDQQSVIIAAIKKRELVEGMTYDEACKAARSRGVLISSVNGRVTYHWPIKGRTGTHQEFVETHTSLITGGSRDEYQTVADYGTVGYVEAKFVDGELVSFRRVAFYGQ
jgi:hypothetical protein